MAAKFIANPNAAYKGCAILGDVPHSDEPGEWSGGRIAEDVCSTHMGIFRENCRRFVEAAQKRGSKLWFLGKR